MKINFVSDVACPWCAVGLWSLDRALEQLGDEVAVDLHFEPFELNPTLSSEGEDATEYLARKYGASADQLAKNRAVIRARCGGRLRVRRPAARVEHVRCTPAAALGRARVGREA